MSFILGLATASPEYSNSQDEVIAAIGRWLADDQDAFETVRSLVINSKVERRMTALPVYEIAQRKSFSERNQLYIETARTLGAKVARDALSQSGLQPDEIDVLVTTSCTGYSLPGLDVQLVHALGLRPDVRRMPFLQLGCSGGVRSLAVAHDALQSDRKRNALVVSVELSSLTFQFDDRSLANLVSSVIFSDGAGAAVLCGDAHAGRSLCEIRDTASYLFPNTEALMGFNLKESGFHIVLDREIPHFIGGHAGEHIWSFINKNKIEPSFAAIHPGGKSVLEALEHACDLPRALLEPSWKILREFGNMSSATVLFILEEALSKNPHGSGIAAAFGPGFCMELLHLERSI